MQKAKGSWARVSVGTAIVCLFLGAAYGFLTGPYCLHCWSGNNVVKAMCYQSDERSLYPIPQNVPHPFWVCDRCDRCWRSDRIDIGLYRF